VLPADASTAQHTWSRASIRRDAAYGGTCVAVPSKAEANARWADGLSGGTGVDTDALRESRGAQCTRELSLRPLVHYAPRLILYLLGVEDQPSPLRAFVELKIGGDVCDWVEQQRKQEPRLGRRPLARRLRELTGRPIDPVTLTRWCPQCFVDDQ
jgi:hypothetical protein